MKFKSENFQRAGERIAASFLQGRPGDFSTDETLVGGSEQPMTFTDDLAFQGAIGTRKADPVKGISG